MVIFLRIFIAAVLGILLLPIPTVARASFENAAYLDKGDSRTSIALPSFGGESGAAKTVTSIIMADLNRSGQFRTLDAGDIGIDDTQRISYSDWKSRGVNALIAGSVHPTSDGRYETRFRLYDVQKGTEVGAKALVAGTKDLRNVAHQVSDFVLEKLAGKRGAFFTRLAYVVQRSDRYYLMIADADGGNPQPALASPRPITSLAWSPDGTRLALVSHEISAPELGRYHPIVFTLLLGSGQRGVVFNPPVTSRFLSVAWSPDGANLAVMSHELDKSALYLVSPDGRESTLVEISKSEDANPSFSADGQLIYFDSNRNGLRQIYRKSIRGGNAELVVGGNHENFAPSLSPDGKSLAYITKDVQGDHLALMGLGGGMPSILSNIPASQRLSFSANSDFVVFSEKSDKGSALKGVSIETHRSVIWAGELEAANSSDFALGPFVGKVRRAEPGPSTGVLADSVASRPAGVISLPTPETYRSLRPAYPPESRQAGEQGKTTLRVWVDKQGLPQTVEIKESSGFARLDQAAIDAIKAWHFLPAQKDGVPIAAWVVVPIVFRLESPESMPDANQASTSVSQTKP